MCDGSVSVQSAYWRRERVRGEGKRGREGGKGGGKGGGEEWEKSLRRASNCCEERVMAVKSE